MGAAMTDDVLFSIVVGIVLLALAVDLAALLAWLTTLKQRRRVR
jgi:hypothetical protein